MHRWALLLLLTACTGDAEDKESGDTDTDDTDDTTTDCGDLDATECAADGDCASIDGREIVPGTEGGPNCLLAAETLGCMDADSVCTEAETRAADPADPTTCYWFRNGCTPVDWVACDPDPGDASEEC